MKQIQIADDHAVFISPAIQTEPHEHHALEIIVSTANLFVVKDNRGDVVASHAVLIMPDQPHQTTTTSQAAFIFIEPESDLAKRILNTLSQDGTIQNLDHVLSATEKDKLASGHIPESFKISHNDSLTLDNRIKNVTNFIRTNIQSHEFNLEMLSEIACLSSGRLTHLFKEQIGIPIRPFILWCRMRVAVTSVLSGMSLTQAAYEAGFSDAAHLSRTFLDMFGVNPSHALKQ